MPGPGKADRRTCIVTASVTASARQCQLECYGLIIESRRYDSSDIDCRDTCVSVNHEWHASDPLVSHPGVIFTELPRAAQCSLPRA